ncbi:unnamed protein product [Urochloa humidicola]
MKAEAALPVPDNVPADILGRLHPCTLAASRCVCKAWRALVDERGLLLRHALRGIFINYSDYEQRSLFFARPSSEFPRVSVDPSHVPGFAPYFTGFRDHCNGLLLYQSYYVINPATR